MPATYPWETGQLYACNSDEWLAQRQPDTTPETLPVAAAQTGSSHDQNVLVETQTGYTQTNFHMGTIAVGITITFSILFFVVLCYCGGKRVMKSMTTVSSLPHHFQAPPPNRNIYDIPRGVPR